ncbi:MAG TPA: hypothetical protein VF658_08550 [Pyrinomonadaceae bacterium]|jgi:hypothetical protein
MLSLSQCFICQAAVTADARVCANCGARLDETLAGELRSVAYLLSELASWEAQGLINVEEAARLRRRYESRREELRAQVASNAEQAKGFASPVDEASSPNASDSLAHEAPRLAAGKRAAAAAGTTKRRAERRPLFETLADPYTLRLLLYTGAAMLVVGIVIWLRDVLYLKLQEPLVQAVLLVCGTIAVTIIGWVTTLRTRLLLTGRALTLIGSVLVPVNFWFLVRSGLISDNGRAWMVCALCAALYAATAVLLRERLYVYLACAASIATFWALVFRSTPEAYGLYALTLMTASLVFLHLSRVFPRASRPLEKERDASVAVEETTDDKSAKDNKVKAKDDKVAELSGNSYELWGRPLVRVALFGASVAALLYRLLPQDSSLSLYDGILRLRASDYDASIAMLLFVALAWVAWFTARFIYTKRRAVLYTTSVLALVWTEFLLFDGLRVSGQIRLAALAATALIVASATRFVAERILAEALHRASAMVLTLLLLIASIIALLFHIDASELDASWRPSLFFVLLATMLFGALRPSRNHQRSIYGAGLATVAALILVATLSDALMAAGVLPESWPIAAGVVGAALLLQLFSLRWLRPTLKAATETAKAAIEERRAVTEKAAADDKGTRVPVVMFNSLDAVIRLVTDSAAVVCVSLWLTRLLLFAGEDGWSAALVFLLALVYWIARALQGRRALFVYLSSAHAGAFLLAKLIALHIEERWFALFFALVLFPLLFALGRLARARGAGWVAVSAGRGAAVLALLISLALIVQAAPLLQTGNELLLAPMLTAGVLCAATLAASLFSEGRERVGYFRVGLGAAVLAFVLLVLRAGFDPIIDVEMYTSPVAVLLLIVSYVMMRGEWDEYARDTGLLMWTGALLLCGPLLIRALQFRLLLDLPAQWRDMSVLGVSLVLVFFGVLGRLRAPVIIGTITLLLELVALALTSVRWLQVPVWVYLITAGVLIIVVWGIFEYRREQLLLMRRRLQERGAQARESFEQWS